jgi:hypothetical protein
MAMRSDTIKVECRMEIAVEGVVAIHVTALNGFNRLVM